MKRVEINKIRRLYFGISLFLIAALFHAHCYAKELDRQKSKSTTHQQMCTSCFVLNLPLIDTMNHNMSSMLDAPDEKDLLFKPWITIPQLAYRWNNVMPMLGIGYQGLHQDDSLTGHQAQGILTWSVFDYYYYFKIDSLMIKA